MKYQHRVQAAMFQNNGFYRGLLGDFEVTSLNDGNAMVDLKKILSDESRASSELSKNHVANPVNLSINAFLVNTGSNLVLIDTGAGELYGSSSGRLVKNLIASGYSPDQVDTIILTHIHADHSGGLTVGGKRLFQNAKVHVNGLDLDYWLSAENEKSAPVDKRKTFQQSRQTVGPYMESGQIVRFTNGRDEEILPSFRAFYSPGHTPGHTSILVESHGYGLLLWGDTVHSSDVQLNYPDVTISFDVESITSIESRMRILDWVSSAGLLIGADHLSFPGLGHLRKRDDCYAWIPLQHSCDVGELDKNLYDKTVCY